MNIEQDNSINDNREEEVLGLDEFSINYSIELNKKRSKKDNNDQAYQTNHHKMLTM